MTGPAREERERLIEAARLRVRQFGIAADPKQRVIAELADEVDALRAAPPSTPSGTDDFERAQEAERFAKWCEQTADTMMAFDQGSPSTRDTVVKLRAIASLLRERVPARAEDTAAGGRSAEPQPARSNAEQAGVSSPAQAEPTPLSAVPARTPTREAFAPEPVDYDAAAVLESASIPPAPPAAVAPERNCPGCGHNGADHAGSICTVKGCPCRSYAPAERESEPSHDTSRTGLASELLAKLGVARDSTQGDIVTQALAARGEKHNA